MPIICPLFGPKFALAKHIKYVNLLADYTNKIFINAEVDMLELNDFPNNIYYDTSFSLTKTLSHIYNNTYYRKFFVYCNGESIEINADSLEIIYLTKINKLKVVKYQPKKGLKSVTFDKTYPLLESTNGIKLGFKNYLLTIISDINTDDRHFMELLDVKNIDLPNCAGALISKDLIIRISDLYGKELFEFDSNPFNSNNLIKY